MTADSRLRRLVELLGPAAAEVLGWCEALPRAGSVRGLDRLVGRRS